MSCTFFVIAGSSPARTAIASFGRSSEVQTILVACGEMAPFAIIAVRFRSKSVARSVCPLATDISLAAWVAPARFEPEGWNEPAGGRTDIGKGYAQSFAVIGPFADLEVRPSNDDRVVNRLAVIFCRGDCIAGTLIVRDHVAPGRHPRDIDLPAGQRHGDAGPVGRSLEGVGDTELLGEAFEDS